MLEYVLGIRGTMSPVDFLTGGFSYVTESVNTLDHADTFFGGNNNTHTVMGVDGTLTLDLLTAAFEYATETTAADETRDIMYVNGSLSDNFSATKTGMALTMTVVHMILIKLVLVLVLVCQLI